MVADDDICQDIWSLSVVFSVNIDVSVKRLAVDIYNAAYRFRIIDDYFVLLVLSYVNFFIGGSVIVFSGFNVV